MPKTDPIATSELHCADRTGGAFPVFRPRPWANAVYTDPPGPGPSRLVASRPVQEGGYSGEFER